MSPTIPPDREASSDAGACPEDRIATAEQYVFGRLAFSEMAAFGRHAGVCGLCADALAETVQFVEAFHDLAWQDRLLSQAG
jgi:hypothetical protein